jgi:Spy/CpxP family protein refolding chaperone
MEVDMKARHIFLTIAAAIVLAAPPAVFAQAGPGPGDGSEPGAAWGGGHGPHGGGPGQFGHPEDGDGLHFFEHMLPRLAEELGLSDDQLSQIQTIIDAARPEIEGFVEQLREGREAYRAENDDPTVFNEATFRAHAEAQHSIQTELGVIAGQAKADALKVLTPEQLEQLDEMRGTFGRKSFRQGGGRRSSS